MLLLLSTIEVLAGKFYHEQSLHQLLKAPTLSLFSCRSELDVVIPKGHHLPCQVQRKYTFRQGGVVSITVVEGVDIADRQVYDSTGQDQGIVDVGTIYLKVSFVPL